MTQLPPAQGWQARAYSYDANHPHAVSAVISDQQSPPEGSSVGSYTYDANGNMTCRFENGEWFIQTYNTENRIASIVKLAGGDCTTPGNYALKWDFGYDGDGVRVSTLTTQYENGVPVSSSVTSYYFGGAYEVRDTQVINCEGI